MGNDLSSLRLEERYYEPKKWGVTVSLSGHRDRWLRYRGRLWWLKGNPDLLDRDRTRRILMRYMRWRLRREHPQSVSEPEATLVGPTLEDPPKLGAYMLAVADVADEDRDAVASLIGRTGYRRIYVPVIRPLRMGL